MYRKEEKNIKDILYILEHLRPEDKEEIEHQIGKDYIWKCLKDIMDSDGNIVMGYTKDGDRPVLMGGCSNAADGVGVVWLLCTEEIYKHPIQVLRNIKKEIELYQKDHIILSNIIYHKNKLAKIWLKKLGFKFDNPSGAKIPDGFEFFYKKKNMRGLNNANSSAVS